MRIRAVYKKIEFPVIEDPSEDAGKITKNLLLLMKLLTNIGLI